MKKGLLLALAIGALFILFAKNPLVQIQGVVGERVVLADDEGKGSDDRDDDREKQNRANERATGAAADRAQERASDEAREAGAEPLEPPGAAELPAAWMFGGGLLLIGGFGLLLYRKFW